MKIRNGCGFLIYSAGQGLRHIPDASNQTCTEAFLVYMTNVLLFTNMTAGPGPFKQSFLSRPKEALHEKKDPVASDEKSFENISLSLSHTHIYI